VDVTLLPAYEQASLIAEGSISARELLAAVIGRYEQVNPSLNAVVCEQIEAAQQRAAMLDQMTARGEASGRFHGVPVTVKDVIDWVGSPSTWGDPRHANYRPDRNATVVDRLEAEGSVVWGKTNVPKDLAEWQTFNTIYGRTNNPWDLQRTPGGSSGGSAVALATGMAGLEIGSDIGGSLRFPAHYCGVFSLKPSFGIVPATGHNYPGQDADVDLNVVGPMARSAGDLATSMDVLSDYKLAADTRTHVSQYRVGVLLDHPLGEPQDNDMTAVLRGFVDRCADAGMQVVDVPTSIDFERAQQNYLMLNYAATSLVERGDRPNAKARGAGLTHAIWLQLANERQRIRNQWAHYFEDVDLVLCPVAAGPAPPHQTTVPFADQTIPVNGRMVSNQVQWIWAGMASGSYLPAAVAPVGRTNNGLPVGIQVIAPFGHDLRSINFARVAEPFGGAFVPPPLVAG
jgi:amidase